MAVTLHLAHLSKERPHQLLGLMRDFDCCCPAHILIVVVRFPAMVPRCMDGDSLICRRRVEYGYPFRIYEFGALAAAVSRASLYRNCLLGGLVDVATVRAPQRQTVTAGKIAAIAILPGVRRFYAVAKDGVLPRSPGRGCS